MNILESMTKEELIEYQKSLQASYEAVQAKKLKLDMSRGKPCSEQLALSSKLLTCLGPSDYKATNGTDCRNYGGVDGLPEAKELMAWFLDAQPEQVIIGGNSSLTMMYDLMTRAMLKPIPGSETAWSKLPQVKFLCPSPGYDRHFGICEHLGIEMIPVPYLADGPDMEEVERLVASDNSIKGMWCVPKYSNPTGVTYSDEVVRRLAAMPTKAPDFRLFWDNAYTVHHLTDQPKPLLSILAACREAGNPDRVFAFASTSKISFPGAGVAMLASSERNISWLKKEINVQTIGPDKLNQLRHVRLYKDRAGIEAHMKNHAALIKPKFDLVIELLEQELGGKGIASWSNPTGGYFISFDALPGCAKQIVAKAAEAGVIMTSAGATYPYGKDPEDRNIRIAPTFPPLAELAQAMELFVLCVKLVSAEQELAKRAN
ncbi:MAG: aminotransferase class I/II-fold pyridoxal phosphate-dependent enzyme [Sporomusaceae bacterium]|nr:aminotransferase class I/II-fold pyridoxal phosphate-dependent enzyme [Sporomusaceae bacterium]